jgi:tetratricopeptide (TPR) repeat protein
MAKTHRFARTSLPHLAAAAVCAFGPLLLGCGLAAQGRNVDGVRYFQQGNYQLALARFQEAMRTDPQNADSYYNMAATLHKIGLQNRDANSLLQAETFYNTCLNYNPNHVDCYRGLAVLLTETGRTQQAFTLLTRWKDSNRLTPAWNWPGSAKRWGTTPVRNDI